MAEEVEQITPEPEAEEQESFREYVERREDELTGRNVEREKQADAIAASVLSALQKATAEEEPSEEAPARDRETGRFSAPVQPAFNQAPMDPLAQARWQGRHEANVERLDARLKSLHEEDPELAEASGKIELPIPVLDVLKHTMAEFNNGDSVFRYLVENPEHCEQMEHMDANGISQLVHKISAALEFGTASTGGVETRVSKAPPPPSPVHKATGASDTALRDSDSYKDWVRKREAQIANRGGR